MAISRRGFLGQLAVVAAGLVGLQLDERRPSRAFVGLDLATGPDYSALVLLNDRRVPPGYEFYVDPKALRRLELHDDDYIFAANP